MTKMSTPATKEPEPEPAMKLSCVYENNATFGVAYYTGTPGEIELVGSEFNRYEDAEHWAAENLTSYYENELFIVELKLTKVVSKVSLPVSPTITKF